VNAELEKGCGRK